MASFGMDETQMLRDLVENLSEGVYRFNLDGQLMSANRALVALNGYASECEMLKSIRAVGREWYVDPERRAEFDRRLHAEGRVEEFISEVFRHKTRERIWVTESARLVRHPRTGRALFYEGSVRDVTETMRRLMLEEQFSRLTRELPGVLFQIEVPDIGIPRLAYLSPGITRITGYPHEAHLADPSLLNQLILPEDQAPYERSLEEARRLLAAWEIEFRITALNGDERWLRVTASPQRNEGMLVWHGYLSDISMRKRHEIEIADLAYFDTLTRLPNRRLFLDRMAGETALGEPGASFGALLFIDLDNFKTLNDTQGHDVGDAFLVQVAERLRGCVAPGDMVARLGGDEFVVVLSPQPDAGRATRGAITVGNRVVSTLQARFTLGPLVHIGSASVGAVTFDRAEARVDEILKRADIAMYQAKGAGRNGLALFDPSTMEREAERFQLLGELRTAIAERQIVLHFQPLLDDTRKLRGAEALARWQHPERSMVRPDQFVPLAEQFGMSAELTRLVLEAGFETLARWQEDPATSGLRLSLNVSALSFSERDFVDLLKFLIDQHEIDPTMLTLELTETVMARDEESVASRMHEMKKLGIRLSLDDFGTGYSSLRLLKKLPLDEIKIDGGFVSDIESSDEDRALVKTILAMARMLDLETVAEHVENIRQESFLRAFGCDYFQGYLYAPAMPAHLFRDFVRVWGGQPSPEEEDATRQVA